MVNDSWLSKKQHKDYKGDFSCSRISGLALLGENEKVLMKVDMLHPNAALDDFNIMNENGYTQWDTATLQEGQQLIGVRGNICELGWLDLLSFNLSDTANIEDAQLS